MLEQVAQSAGHVRGWFCSNVFHDFLEPSDVRRRSARGQHFAQPAVEHGQAGLILPPAYYVRKRGGQVLHVFQLGTGRVARTFGAETHRSAGIDCQGAVQIGFFFVQADECLARAG